MDVLDWLAVAAMMLGFAGGVVEMRSRRWPLGAAARQWCEILLLASRAIFLLGGAGLLSSLVSYVRHNASFGAFMLFGAVTLALFFAIAAIVDRRAGAPSAGGPSRQPTARSRD